MPFLTIIQTVSYAVFERAVGTVIPKSKLLSQSTCAKKSSSIILMCWQGCGILIRVCGCAGVNILDLY